MGAPREETAARPQPIEEDDDDVNEDEARGETPAGENDSPGGLVIHINESDPLPDQKGSM